MPRLMTKSQRKIDFTRLFTQRSSVNLSIAANAGRQARQIAGAQRTLFVVACMRLLGAEAAPTSALLMPNRAVLWYGEKGQVHTAVSEFFCSCHLCGLTILLSRFPGNNRIGMPGLQAIKRCDSFALFGDEILDM